MLCLEHRLTRAHNQLRRSMSAGEGSVGQHAFISNPVAREIYVLCSRSIDRRPPGEASVGSPDYRLGDTQFWQKTLMFDLISPPRLYQIQKLFKLRAVARGVRCLTIRNVLSRFDHSFSRRRKVRPARMDRKVNRLIETDGECS